MKNRWEKPNNVWVYYGDSGAPVRTLPAGNSNMNSNEFNLAQEIFAAYNSFRKSKGLSELNWWESCEQKAWESVNDCAAKGRLEHHSGKIESWDFSDILQYSTFKMSGEAVVQRWNQSDNHRKMMQCNSAAGSAVAVCNNGGTWYCALVYTWTGANSSGS